ncbi:hypothetical protein [uncultured Roseibium sp.]|uniref:hypothetical protein n=1 Tax=uncultured Roseibium sp. TaxID=1936171 RepID=UPI003216F0CD
MTFFTRFDGRIFRLEFPARAVSLWRVVELGFFNGTPGENRYGSDPLAAANG